jgi:hypothetical protein
VRGAAVRHGGDECAQPHPLGARGEPRQRRPALAEVVPRAADLRDLAEVVHHVERVEADGLGGDGDLPQPRAERGRAAAELADVQGEAQPDRPLGLPCGRLPARRERGRHHAHRLRGQDVVEALAGQGVADGGPGPQLRGERRGRHGVRTGAVAGPADRGGGVEADGHARRAPRAGQLPPAGAAVGVEPGRVDDGGQPARDPAGDDLLQQRERVGARRDVVLTRPDDGAQAVGGHDLVAGEVRGRPRRLAGPRRPGQHDQARRGEPQHRVRSGAWGSPAGC